MSGDSKNKNMQQLQKPAPFVETGATVRDVGFICDYRFNERVAGDWHNT
jgi:hypothetical protein